MESLQNSNFLVTNLSDFSIVISMGAVYSSSDKKDPEGSSQSLPTIAETITTTKTKTRKRPSKRTKYTLEQIQELETAFQENKYVSLQKRKQLSEICQLTEIQIKVWFQNRRKKEQRRIKKEKEFEKRVNQYLLSLIQSTHAESFNDLVHFLDSNNQCQQEISNFCPHEYFHQTSLKCPCGGVENDRTVVPTVDWSVFDGNMPAI